MRLPGFELPEAIWRAVGEFDDELPKMLDAMGNRFQGKPAGTSDLNLPLG
ncbi:MAG TPA: hypothetical protein VHZ55_26250 [Bryobacteraceae bacterium]|nr:hypothetical protein [Bryobacteraceae bacterium]